MVQTKERDLAVARLIEKVEASQRRCAAMGAQVD
jgi:hypothetical protein